LDLCEHFIQEFFDQNPISQLGIIVTHDKTAERIVELSGNPKQQIKTIREKLVDGGGEMSMQLSLNIALNSLKSVPSYATREVVMILGGLNTTDPGDIRDTITSLAQNSIRCSVIGLAAEMQVCRTLAKSTGGTYLVALNEKHYKDILFKHIAPAPSEKGSKKANSRKYVKMGFPQKRSDAYPSLCACHTKLTYQGYYCPKCLLKYCELPTECSGCSLNLISSPHLARSYHHLFVVPAFPEVISDAIIWTDTCFACRTVLNSDRDIRSQCPRCQQIFCVECDIYIHNALHNCPGCTSTVQSAPAGPSNHSKSSSTTNNHSKSSSSASAKS